MTILEQIKATNIQAMKDKNANARGILSILLNKVKLAEIAKRETKTDLIEADIVSILIKTAKELSEEMESYQKANYLDRVQDIKLQLEIVEKLLPKMMSADEIKAEISNMADKSVPSVMKHFKANFVGKCDMRLVQEVLKTI